jgi:hypothetical protein
MITRTRTVRVVANVVNTIAEGSVSVASIIVASTATGARFGAVTDIDGNTILDLPFNQDESYTIDTPFIADNGLVTTIASGTAAARANIDIVFILSAEGT